MKQEQSTLNSSEQAVARVKLLFSRDQKNFLQTNLSKNGQLREYDYVKMPKLLPTKPKISLIQQGEGLSKKQISSSTHLSCSLSPRYLMHLLMQMKSVSVRKIHNLHLKEYLLAQRNFQRIGKEMNEWMTSYLKNKIQLISKEKPKNKDETPWEDFVTPKEERQFLINRIIRYLLD